MLAAPWGFMEWGPASGAQRPCIDPDFLTGKLPGRRVPRKENEHVRAHWFARRRRSVPRAELCAGQLRRFEHALRTDDDLREVELHVRERAEERRVEMARPLVALPPLAGRDDFINTVRGQCGDKAIEVAAILSLGVVNPKAADGLMEFRRCVPAQPIHDRRWRGPGFSVWRIWVCRWLIHKQADVLNTALLRRSSWFFVKHC